MKLPPFGLAFASVLVVGRPVAALVPLSVVEHRLHRLLTAHRLIEPARPRRSFAADQRLAGPPLSAEIDVARGEKDPWTA